MKSTFSVQLLALLGSLLAIESSQAQSIDSGAENAPRANAPRELLRGDWVGRISCGPYLGTAKVSEQRRRPFQGKLTMVVGADGGATILRAGADFKETSSGSISPDFSLRTAGQGAIDKSDTYWKIQYAGQYSNVQELPGFVGTAQLLTPIGGVLRECTFVTSRGEEKVVRPVNTDSAPIQARDAANQPEVGNAPKESPGVSSSLFSSIRIRVPPYYHGSPLFALGGGIGGAIGAVVGRNEPARIAQFVSREAIDFPAMLSTEFERQLRNDPVARLAYEKKGPATFQMVIFFGITSVPFSDYRPYLSIRMKLVDANGVEKWADREYVGGFGKAKVLPYLDFFKSREIFISEFESAANEVVTLLLRNLSR